MKTNLEKAKTALLEEMQTDDQWRNYYRDTIDCLVHEHELEESDSLELYQTMKNAVNQ